MALISDYINSIPKAERGLVVIDPVFGDNGKLYETQQAQIVDSMRAFIRLADVITPNMTEAAYLAGEEPAEEIDLETVKRQLASFGVSKAVITGVRLSEHPGKLCVCGMAGGVFHLAQTDLVPGTFHGTGDTFASVLTACLLLGKSFAFAMETAANFVCLCCKQVTENQISLCEGLPVEGLIPALQKSVLSVL